MMRKGRFKERGDWRSELLSRIRTLIERGYPTRNGTGAWLYSRPNVRSSHRCQSLVKMRRGS
jgi:hypothetical protein